MVFQITGNRIASNYVGVQIFLLSSALFEVDAIVVSPKTDIFTRTIKQQGLTYVPTPSVFTETAVKSLQILNIIR